MSAPQLLARWVIRRAARALPEAERVEAEAEWLRHMEDLPTRWHKLRHVVGLWTSSGAIKPQPRMLNLDLANMGSAALLIATLGQTIVDVRDGAPLALIFPEVIFGIPGAGTALVAGLIMRRKGRVVRMD